MPNGVQTKSWIKQQRIALKESGLPADKVELLRAIGIVGNLMEQNWMRDYECIKAYVEEHHQLLSIKILSSCRTEARVRSGLPIGVLRCAMARCRKEE